MVVGGYTSINTVKLACKFLSLVGDITSIGGILLTKQQVVITHTIHQTEISPLLDSSVKNTPSVKMLCPQKFASTCIFVKT
jgi:hypothetical protein